MNPDLVERKLHELDRYINNLKKHRGIEVAELQADMDKAWIIEHGLQLCISSGTGYWESSSCRRG